MRATMINRYYYILLLACLLLIVACEEKEQRSSFSDAVDVCVGLNYSCALRSNGKITCWGSNLYGESSISDTTNFKAISCASSVTCGLTTDGAIRCWGEQGRCFEGDTSNGGGCIQTPATQPPAETGYMQLVVAGNTACALKADGTVHCWGDVTNSCFTPPTDGKQYIQIDGDGCTYCGLTASGDVDCGMSHYLESEPDVIEQPWDYKPLPEDMSFSYITVEGNWACGIQKNNQTDVYCWGEDTLNQLAPTGYSWNPEGAPAIRIDSCDWFKCILRKGKEYKCYGQEGGILRYPPNDDFIQLAMEGTHGCGILKNGHVRCWGDDYKGQSSPP
jgi:hypothetical protein